MAQLDSLKESKREVVRENRPRHLINLSPRAQHHTRVPKSTASFAYHTHKLHKEISTLIQKRNANIKLMQICIKELGNLK